MDARAENGSEPPPPIAAALGAVDVYIAPTSKSLSHTKARKAATEAGVRGATLPGVTAELLARVMAVDFEVMAGAVARGRASCSRRAARPTSPARRAPTCASDLTGRAGIPDDGVLVEPGAFGNLPCGEGFISPIGGDGVAMVTGMDGAIAREPERFVLEGGHLVAADGEHGSALLAKLRAHGENGTNLAELGVGTNDRATLTGNVLEDEKILGSIHIAFGASAGDRRHDLGADPPGRHGPGGDARPRRHARAGRRHVRPRLRCSSAPPTSPRGRTPPPSTPSRPRSPAPAGRAPGRPLRPRPQPLGVHARGRARRARAGAARRGARGGRARRPRHAPGDPPARRRARRRAARPPRRRGHAEPPAPRRSSRPT